MYMYTTFVIAFFFIVIYFSYDKQFCYNPRLASSDSIEHCITAPIMDTFFKHYMSYRENYTNLQVCGRTMVQNR